MVKLSLMSRHVLVPWAKKSCILYSAPCRRHVVQLEEGDVGTLHPMYRLTYQPWVVFMAKLSEFYSAALPPL